jgi:hypothetical protein
VNNNNLAQGGNSGVHRNTFSGGEASDSGGAISNGPLGCISQVRDCLTRYQCDS